MKPYFLGNSHQYPFSKYVQIDSGDGFFSGQRKMAELLKQLRFHDFPEKWPIRENEDTAASYSRRIELFLSLEVLV